MEKYSLFDLFEKYHSANKYQMLKYMNYNRPKNENNPDYKLYNMDGEYYYDQDGGDKEEFIYGDKTYIFDIYKKKEDKIRRVFIKSLNSTTKSSDPESDNCAQLVYESESDKLKIESLNGNRGCIKLKSNQSKKVEKQGTMLMYAIIDWAKRKNFKKIVLEDESFIECVDSKIHLTYPLKLGYIFQTGYSWYWKFGFRYNSEQQNLNAKKISQYLDKLKTSDLAFENLIEMFMSKLIYHNYIQHDMLDNKKILNQIAQMSEIYIAKKDMPAYEFFKDMYYSCCEIMALITVELFDSLGLNIDKNKQISSQTNKMVLLL